MHQGQRGIVGSGQYGCGTGAHAGGLLLVNIHGAAASGLYRGVLRGIGSATGIEFDRGSAVVLEVQCAGTVVVPQLPYVGGVVLDVYGGIVASVTSHRQPGC